MGLGYGWVAPILANSNSTLSLTIQEASWIASIQDFGRTLGPLIAGFSADIVGRKFLLQVCALVYFLSWTIIAFTRSVTVISVVRLLFGISVGVNDVLSSIYLGENSLPKFRGIFGSINVAFYYGGILFEYIIATYCSYQNTIIINAIIGSLIVLWSFFLKEPPQFLIMKGKPEKAERTMRWLKGGSAKHTRCEFQKIVANVEEEKLKKASIKQLFTSPVNYKSLIIIIVLNLLAMSTGNAAVNNFVSLAFESSGSVTANELTILFGVLQFLAVCISATVIELFNRRTVILVSGSLVAVTHACTAILYYCRYQQNYLQVEYFPWLVFVTISAYAMIFSAGIDPMLYVIRAELFPQSIKPIGGCAAIMANSLSAFWTGNIFLTVAKFYGLYVNFVFFCVAGLGLIVYVYFTVPETRGKTLVQIQEELREKV